MRPRTSSESRCIRSRSSARRAARFRTVSVTGTPPPISAARQRRFSSSKGAPVATRYVGSPAGLAMLPGRAAGVAGWVGVLVVILGTCGGLRGALVGRASRAGGGKRTATCRPRITRRCFLQLHSIDYHNLAQLRDGGVLIVGAGNSGAGGGPAGPHDLQQRDEDREQDVLHQHGQAQPRGDRRGGRSHAVIVAAGPGGRINPGEQPTTTPRAGRPRAAYGSQRP